ncbi:hypothetical protein LCGC14_0727920 [marine sediment metagenome]|uniref:Uncharacterized protein n=1 Tax=marine sediment metagenome TaxID=412755 RepID=A0A0F9QAH1_9ZZZZ
MALGTLELVVGSDLTLDRDNLIISRRFRVRGTLTGLASDVFDTVASYVMAAIVMGGTDSNGHQYGPTYMTPQGLLYWNSIQLHESFYAQAYEITVVFSPFNKQTGTFLLRIEHAAGTAKATAGVRQAGYPAAKFPAAGAEADKGNKGVIFDGLEVVGVDVPYNQTRIVISYRHPQMFLNHTYLRAVGKLVGHPNNDMFLGYDPGEIAYAGGNATESEAEASAEYSFEVSRNETDLVVGDITIATKKGFDIVSPIYQAGVETDQATDKYGVRIVEKIEIIRPIGREFENYVDVFGWGGP